MKAVRTEEKRIKQILEQTRSELVQALRERDGIAIEKSADPMDEIQCASERDLAIQNVDRDSNVLSQVSAALQRLGDGTFGNCIECEQEIGQKRLKALPWAPRCVRCQDAFDHQSETNEFATGEFAYAS